MYNFQSLYEYLSGFHFLTFWPKICSAAQSVISKGTKFQIVGPRINKKLQLEGLQCAIMKLCNMDFPGHFPNFQNILKNLDKSSFLVVLQRVGW